MELKTQENEKENDNGNMNLQLEKGRWLTCYVNHDQLAFLMELKANYRNLGMPLSLSKIISKVSNIGWSNIDMEAVLNHPMSLFQEAS